MCYNNTILGSMKILNNKRITFSVAKASKIGDNHDNLYITLYIYMAYLIFKTNLSNHPVRSRDTLIPNKLIKVFFGESLSLLFTIHIKGFNQCCNPLILLKADGIFGLCNSVDHTVHCPK